MGSPPVTAVFDTNIVIDLLNVHPEAAREYDKYDSVIISRITWIESLVGANDSETRAFLARRFQFASLTTEISEQTITLRRQHRKLRLPDAIIWATAMEHDCVLVTRNTRDFSAKEKSVRVPYKI